MSLLIYKDSYISLEDANTYIQENYLSTDNLRVMWDALDIINEDGTVDSSSKEILLRRAFKQINRLPFTGRPLNPNQTLPFPRHGNDNGLENVKYAQVELALTYNDKIANNEIAQRKMLQSAGVKKYSIGDLSEEFRSGATTAGASNFFGIGEVAYQYLKNYLGGGYKICTSTKRPHGRW